MEQWYNFRPVANRRVISLEEAEERLEARGPAHHVHVAVAREGCRVEGRRRRRSGRRRPFRLRRRRPIQDAGW